MSERNDLSDISSDSEDENFWALEELVKKHGSKRVRKALDAHKEKMKTGAKKLKDLTVALKDNIGLSAEELLNLKNLKKELAEGIELQEKFKKYDKHCAKAMAMFSKTKDYLTKVMDMMEQIKENENFRTDEEIQALKEKIRSIEKRNLENEMDNCPICQEIPAANVEIRSCQSCGGIFCDPCIVTIDERFKVETCPLCKISMETKPMIRNLYAEKIIKNYHTTK